MWKITKWMKKRGVRIRNAHIHLHTWVPIWIWKRAVETEMGKYIGRKTYRLPWKTNYRLCHSENLNDWIKLEDDEEI